MRTVRTASEVRAALENARRDGARVGLVPTMGALHDGHLSLIRRARAECDTVVVSLFVNPAQFNDPRDLDSYPRDEGRDARLAQQEGADYLFAPPPEELYPAGFSTTVSVSGITEKLEGAHRGRSHFDGVSTIVAKLLNIVSPQAAYFGQKDAQQALVIRRLVEDLNFPVSIEVGPTVREPDGLAMSSRNVLLDGGERPRAARLYRALLAVQAAVEAGEHDPAAARAGALAELTEAGIEPDYLELVSTESLMPVATLGEPALALVAARVGRARLIDNLLIDPTKHATQNGSS